MRLMGARLALALGSLSVLAVACNPMGTSRDATSDEIQFGSTSPSGEWRLGDTVAGGMLQIEALPEGRTPDHSLVLPRLSDLKFVDWGPGEIDGSDVIWIYSADVGTLLYLVSDAGIERLACPSEVVPPSGWPGESRIRCSAS